MTKKANPKLIGGFVLGAVALLTAGIMIFGSGRFFQKSQKYVLFFETDVKGLTVGAPVTLKGVTIGSVTEVRVLFDRELLRFRTPVYIEIFPDSVTEIEKSEGTIVRDLTDEARGTQQMVDLFIQRGLRGVLQLQSLVTGKLQVALEFKRGTPVYLEGLDPNVPEIPTVPSEMQQLISKLEDLKLDDLVEKAAHAVSSIDKLVSSAELEDAVKSLDQTLKDFGKLARNADREVVALSNSAQVALKDARKLVRNVDSQVPRLSDNAVDTLKAAESALNEAENLLVKVDEEIIGERAALRYQLVVTLEELSQAARSIRLLAEFLEQRPDALIRGKAGLGGK